MNTVLDEGDENNDLVEMLLESIFPKCEDGNHFENNYEINDIELIDNLKQESVKDQISVLQNECQTKDDFTEYSIENCYDMLEYNKQIISSLMDLKSNIILALTKCQKKLAVIECNLKKNIAKDTKISICNAGMPYFKDKHYFFASNNEDEMLKESYKELQLKNLPKISAWTKKERDVLLDAVKKEAEGEKEYNNRKKKFSSTDILETVNPLQQKEFDWFKISSNYFEDVHSPFDCRIMWNVFLHPNINRKHWTKSEITKLKRIVQKYEFQNWDKIAKELNTNRSAYQCLIRYNTRKTLPKVHCIWENEEDKRLLKLVEIFQIGDFIPWGNVTSWMQNRTKQQVYFRWSYSLSPYLTKGRFTKTEDDILKDAVTKYGTNFRKISAALMPNRSTIQLHDRYQTLTINQIESWTSWTLEEDTKLLHLFQCIGPNWSVIAKNFSCKTRTQLRHRYTALQKYIKRGVSILELHKYRLKNKVQHSENENKEQRKEELCKNIFEPNNSITNEGHDNNITNIDQELIDYFHKKCKAEYLIRKWKLHDVEKLKRKTISLYNILQALNAKLCISNNIIDKKLNNRDQQLLHSLREYIKLKSDKKKYFQIVEEYESRMFKRNESEQDSCFLPPCPFDSQIKLKKLKKCIDYDIDRSNKFVFELPTDFNTSEFIIPYIGGDEQELQFQKFARSFQVNNPKCCESAFETRNCSTFLTKLLLQRRCRTNNSNDRNNSTDKTLKKLESVVHFDIGTAASHENDDVNYKSQYMEFQSKCLSNGMTEITQNHETSMMYASYATLISFKNLTYLKRLNEKYSFLDEYFIPSSELQAFNLLETRLEQLFKYPLGLSNISLPQVYVEDTFLFEDIPPKKRRLKY